MIGRIKAIDKMSSVFPAHRVEGKAGAGLKPEHLYAILEQADAVGFFEVHAENYMGAGGPPHAALTRIRNDYPVSLHGICMSIGGPEPLDRDHLARFKALVERYEPALVWARRLAELVPEAPGPQQLIDEIQRRRDG